MNSTKETIHFEITASNEELMRKLAESRQAILNSGKTAEAEGAKIEDMFKRAATAASFANAVISKNPYVAAAAAAGVLISKLYEMATAQTNAERASQTLGSAIDEENEKLDKAYEAITNANEGTEERKTAVDSFNQVYGQYLGNLLTEKSAIEDVAGAYNKAKTAVIDYAIERARESYISDPMADVDRTKASLRSSTSKWGEKLGDAGKSGALMAEIDKLVSRLEGGEVFSEGALYKIVSEAFAKQTGFKDNSHNAIQTKGIALKLQREIGNLRTARTEFESFSKGYRDASVTASAEAADNSIQTITTVTKNLEDASEALNKANKELEDARSSGADKSIVKQKMDNVDVAQKNYDGALKLQGIDPKAAAKAKEAAAKAKADSERAAKEVADAELAATKALYDAKTELTRKQITDKVKLMEFDLEETLKRLEEQAVAQEELGHPEAAKTIREQKVVVKESAQVDINAENAARLTADKETLEKLLSEYATYADKRKKIEEQFDADIAKLKAKNTGGEYDGQIKQAEEAKKTALSKINLAEANKGIDFTRLFGGLDSMKLPDLKVLQDKIKVWIDDAGKELSPEDFKTVSDAFQKLNLKVADKGMFGTWIAALGELRTKTKEVETAQKELDAINSKGTKTAEEVADAQLKLKAAEDSRLAAAAAATASTNRVGKKGTEAIGVAKDVMNIMGDLGIKVPPEIAGAVEGVGQMMDGLSSINLTNPMSIVTGAVKIIGGLVKSISSIFNGDNKKEKEIQNIQKQIDALQTSYDTLGEAVDKAYSTDASKMIGQQNEMLEQQKVLIQNQMASEQSKKNTDDEKIKQYQTQLDAIDKTIEGNQEKALDAIFGEDLKSAIENFATAYADAWTKGEDRSKAAKDTVRNMMRDMVTESIKAAIQSSGAMEKIRKKLEEFYADEVLSEWEQDYIYGMADELQKDIDRQFGWADSLMKDEVPEEEREASSKGIASMSQDSADELNGRFTAMQGMLFDMKNNQVQQLDLQRLHLPNLQYLSQLSHLSTISENTAYCRRLEGIENDMSVVRGELQTMNLKGLIIRK